MKEKIQDERKHDTSKAIICPDCGAHTKSPCACHGKPI